MTDRQLAAALAGSAASAAATPAAPSMRAALALDDTHRWRWVVHPDSLDLYADHAGADRPAGTRADPDTRSLLLSSGGALFHARIALAAEGRLAQVRLLPEGDRDPDHLATVTAAREIAVTAEARELYDLIGREAADQPAPQGGPTPAELARLVAAAQAEGVGMRPLNHEQVASLAAATGIGRGRVARDRGDAYTVLYGQGDSPELWLRAGAALSAVWLLAARIGVSVTPSTAAVALPGSRGVLAALLGDTAVPYLAMRLGRLGSE